MKKRRPEKRPKDLAHIYETASLWFYEAERVSEMVGSLNSHSHDWSRWIRRGKETLFREFESETADGPVSAEQVFRSVADGHLANAPAVARLTRSFLEAVFRAV